MARMFVLHDATGRILGVASVEAMPEELAHPFYLDDPAHGVVEVGEEDPAFAEGIDRAHETHKVDVAARTLVPAASTSTPAERKSRSRKPPSR